MTVTPIARIVPQLQNQEAVSAEMQRRLQAAETSLDQALVTVAQLGAGLAESRLRLGLSGTVAQRVFDAAAEAQQSLTRARGAVVDVHNGCEAVRRKFRMPLMGAPEPKDDAVIAPRSAASAEAA